jgi:hypothetical protein
METYKLIKKTLDINSPDQSFTFTSPYIIKDICGNEDVFFVAHENGVGRIEGEEVDLEWHKTLVNPDPYDNPSSLDIRKNFLYIVEQGGSQIRRIDISDRSSKLLIQNESFKKKYFRNDKSPTKITTYKNDLVWSVTNINRCFALRGFSPKALVGNGKSGYSISTPANSRVSKPNGISKVGDIIVIADSGNNCIRGVSRGSVMQLVGGLNHPRDIVSNHNRLFFISGQKVYTVPTAGKSASVYEIYQSANEVISICTTDKKNIYILEIINEQRKTESENK